MKCFHKFEHEKCIDFILSLVFYFNFISYSILPQKHVAQVYMINRFQTLTAVVIRLTKNARTIFSVSRKTTF